VENGKIFPRVFCDTAERVSLGIGYRRYGVKRLE